MSRAKRTDLRNHARVMVLLVPMFLRALPVAAEPRLVATPVRNDASGLGVTTITWDTGDGRDGHLFVVPNGDTPKLFAEGVRGSAPASWIAPGGTYEFRLYGGADQRQLLASVVVRGSPDTQSGGRLIDVSGSAVPRILLACAIVALLALMGYLGYHRKH